MILAFAHSAALIFALTIAAYTQPAPAFRSNVELVTVPVTVLDAQGASVTGLTRDQFRVYDNGAQRIIDNLWVDAGLPLTLGILIDASGSQSEQVEEHRATAQAILKRVLRPGDQAFIISVDEEVRTWPDLSRPPAEIFGTPCPKRATNLAGAKPLSECGASPLWNAIYDAARLKLRSATGNQALLMLTDGFDSGSTHTWQQAADEALKAESRVYAIHYASASGNKYAPDLLRLVAETGGASFTAPRGDLAPILTRLEADLRPHYVLGFRPEKLSGKLRHELRVEVALPNVTVRARRTYFAP
ncbi:MAG TPA: VWA domain-containing protein [Candidatus Solibacter sp.]|nr:VWA domain-containing protein [Candidatus Solibacter sp.]